MADLTACYFCGDSSVEEYPVIPPRMDPPEDAQRTVALCSDCHEKLGTVLRAVVDFVGGGAGRDAGVTAGAGAGGDAPATGNPDDVWFEQGSASEQPNADREGSATAGGRTNEATGGGPPGPGSGAPATAPESYRKVLRLLQNREFPVDRAEFETVAANAYELSPGEVGAALDAAVDRGLIDEDEGTLHRPS